MDTRVGTTFRNLVRTLIGEPRIVDGTFPLERLPTLLGKADPVILDIGCNDGSHTLAFLDLFPASRVFAFEPDPRAQRRFKDKVHSARAVLSEVAISNVDSVADFNVSGGLPSAEWNDLLPDGWDLSGSLMPPKNHLRVHPWCSFDVVIPVRTTRLDTWWNAQGRPNIDFIWADVQGAERLLIDGGSEALRHTRFFFTEYSNQELYKGQARLRDLLRALPDFEVLTRYPDDVLLRNKIRDGAS